MYIIYVCMKSMIFKVQVDPLLLVPADPVLTRPETDFNTPFTVVKEDLPIRSWSKAPCTFASVLSSNAYPNSFGIFLKAKKSSHSHILSCIKIVCFV